MISIIGGDPALIHTGLTLPDGSTHSIITGDSVKGDRRLTILRQNLIHFVRVAPADFAVLEDLPYHSKGNTAGVAMGHGIFRQVLDEYAVPVALIVPATLKMFATGKGNADKAEMLAAANRHRQRWVTIHSTQAPFSTTVLEGTAITDHNEADSWWAWQMGRYFAGVCDLDPEVDEFLHPEVIRHQCVHGPWRKAPGAKWPDKVRAAAAR